MCCASNASRSIRVPACITGADTTIYFVAMIATVVLWGILDISRIESGSMSLKNAEFSFAHELEQVNAIVTAQCHDKKIRYNCNVKDGVSNCYIGDEMKLRQVLINILGNAPCALP